MKPVIRSIEIVGDDQVTDLVPGERVDEQPAEDGLLGFYRMRRRRGPGVGHLDVTARTQRPSHVMSAPRALLRA